MSEDKPVRPWDMFNKNIGRVKPEVAEARLSACLGCKHLIKMTKQCKKCGCFMEAKTKLPHAECPIGKWGKEKELYTEEIE